MCAAFLYRIFAFSQYTIKYIYWSKRDFSRFRGGFSRLPRLSAILMLGFTRNLEPFAPG